MEDNFITGKYAKFKTHNRARPEEDVIPDTAEVTMRDFAVRNKLVPTSFGVHNRYYLHTYRELGFMRYSTNGDIRARYNKVDDKGNQGRVTLQFGHEVYETTPDPTFEPLNHDVPLEFITSDKIVLTLDKDGGELSGKFTADSFGIGGGYSLSIVNGSLELKSPDGTTQRFKPE